MSKNVVGYYRTSTTTNEKSDSRTRQSISVKNYSKSKGWNIQNEFYDVVSGTTNILERKEFVKMLSFCEEHSIDHILFDGVDRLSRDLLVSEYSYEYLTNKMGFTLISVKNDRTFTDTSSTGVLVRQILSTISSFEKNSLVEKLRVSRERKSKKNKELGILSRNGFGKCGGRRKLTEIHSNLSGLVVSYKKMIDKKTRKPLSNSKISKLLLEHEISVSYKTIGKILEDVEMEKRERRNRRRRKNITSSNTI